MSDPLTPGSSQEPLPPPAASGLAPGWERQTMERLMFATLAEQRSNRRWRTFTRLAWLAFFVLLFWSLSPTAHREAETAKAHRG